MTPDALVSVHGLCIHAGPLPLLRDVNLEVFAGECLTLLGESGAGKSLLAQAIMGNLPRVLQASGRIGVAGQHSDAAHPQVRRPLWGRTLALLPQEPSLALDPLRRLGPQLADVLRLVRGLPGPEAAAQASQRLTAAGLASAHAQYPWQVSGGMAQRATACMAVAGGARILLADEPTKGLDRHWADQTIAGLKQVQREGGCVLIITHDLRVARQMGGRLLVLRHGEVVEHGETAAVLAAPRHAFTRQLVAAEPTHWRLPPAPAPGAPVLHAQGLAKRLGGRVLFDELTLDIRRHQRIVLQGASGVGKSTLGNVLLGLLRPDRGEVRRDPGLPPHALQKLYQDPVSAFAPQATLGQLLRDACALHRQPWDALLARLARLKIPESLLARRAPEVSGGELQRVALARALLAHPALLFADEPTSRLDPVTQQEAMQLLLEHAADSEAALVLVTHDEDIARQVSTRILHFGDNGLVRGGDDGPDAGSGSGSGTADAGKTGVPAH